jgi:hypothetical protein
MKSSFSFILLCTLVLTAGTFDSSADSVLDAQQLKLISEIERWENVGSAETHYELWAQGLTDPTDKHLERLNQQGIVSEKVQLALVGLLDYYKEMYKESVSMRVRGTVADILKQQGQLSPQLFTRSPQHPKN